MGKFIFDGCAIFNCQMIWEPVWTALPQFCFNKKFDFFCEKYDLLKVGAWWWFESENIICSPVSCCCSFCGITGAPTFFTTAIYTKASRLSIRILFLLRNPNMPIPAGSIGWSTICRRFRPIRLAFWWLWLPCFCCSWFWTPSGVAILLSAIQAIPANFGLHHYLPRLLTVCSYLLKRCNHTASDFHFGI